jgi:hypothetical protein
MESLKGIGWHDKSVLMRIYGLGFAAVFALFALMYFHAYKLREKLDLNPVESLVTRVAIQENLALTMFGAVSFLIAFKQPGLAGMLYMGIAIFFSIHSSIMGKRVRLLHDRLAASAQKASEPAEAAVEN